MVSTIVGKLDDDEDDTISRDPRFFAKNSKNENRSKVSDKISFVNIQ